MRKKTFILWKRIMKRIFLVFLIICVFYIYFKTGLFTIKKYEIEGLNDANKVTLNEKLTELSKNKTYKILPGNRILSFHKNEIEKYINESLPNTKTIKIRPISLHVLKISVTSHTPIFRTGGDMAINAEALVYKEINNIDNLAVIDIASSTKVSAEVLTGLSDLTEQIKTVLFDIKYIKIDEIGDIYLKENKESKRYIVLTSTAQFKKAWSTLLSAIDTNPLKNNLLNNSNNLEYIDLRFGNKVFYKFTTSQSKDIIQSHDNTTATTTISQ